MFVKRNPTVVSLAQLGDEAPALGVISAPQSKVSECTSSHLPKYVCARRSDSDAQLKSRVRSFGELTKLDVDADASVTEALEVSSAASGETPEEMSSPSSVSETDYTTVLGSQSVLDAVLLAEWEDRAEQGLFRYDVTACPTKVVSGIYGFVAQCNEGRATKKRPTEFRVDQVVQDFDADKFNFLKAMQKEVLFQFEPNSDRTTARYLESSACSDSPHLVLINISPIEYGHVLLVPKVLHRIPQLVDPESMLLALSFTEEVGNPYFRLGYNSLGAYATINHLHFQGYYLQAPYPVERAPVEDIPGLPAMINGVKVGKLAMYPVQGFVFECTHSKEAMAQVIGQLCQQLQALNQPHNLLIADCGARVFLWPQCYAEKQANGLVREDALDTGVNPAAFEIAGHLVMKRLQDYDGLSQDSAWRLLEEVSLTEHMFDELAASCFAP